MSQPDATPEERFAGIVETLLDEADVTFGSSGGKGFGSSALKTDNRIFAMLVEGKLVVKLPRKRVDELVASGDGDRFEPGHGRVMKEWAMIPAASGLDWLKTAREAKAFVASGKKAS